MKVTRQIDPRNIERARDRWRLAAVGMICLVAGATLMAASGSGVRDSAYLVQESPKQDTGQFVAVILDPNKGSGRWASTLLAVRGDGEIFYLDTSRPNTNWARYMYSPGFKNSR